MRPLKGAIAVCEDRENTSESRVCERLDKISELWALIDGLSGQRAPVAELIEAELIHIWPAIAGTCWRWKAR